MSSSVPYEPVEHTGKGSLLGALVSLLGVVAIVKPSLVPMAGAIQQAVPQVQEAVGVILASGGTIISAVSHPPTWLRRLFGRR